MTKWMYRLLGIGIIVAAFNIVRLCGGNAVIDIAFLVLIIPIAVSFIFCDNNENVIEEDEES